MQPTAPKLLADAGAALELGKESRSRARASLAPAWHYATACDARPACSKESTLATRVEGPLPPFSSCCESALCRHGTAPGPDNPRERTRARVSRLEPDWSLAGGPGGNGCCAHLPHAARRLRLPFGASCLRLRRRSQAVCECIALIQRTVLSSLRCSMGSLAWRGAAQPAAFRLFLAFFNLFHFRRLSPRFILRRLALMLLPLCSCRGATAFCRSFRNSY